MIFVLHTQYLEPQSAGLQHGDCYAVTADGFEIFEPSHADRDASGHRLMARSKSNALRLRHADERRSTSPHRHCHPAGPLRGHTLSLGNQPNAARSLLQRAHP